MSLLAELNRRAHVCEVWSRAMFLYQRRGINSRIVLALYERYLQESL